MIKVDMIVGFVGGRCKGEYAEQKAWENGPATSSEIKVSFPVLSDPGSRSFLTRPSS